MEFTPAAEVPGQDFAAGEEGPAAKCSGAPRLAIEAGGHARLARSSCFSEVCELATDLVQHVAGGVAPFQGQQDVLPSYRHSHLAVLDLGY